MATHDTSRRPAFSRLIAVWLVVLIAVPFTAPFRTIDLDALEAGVQLHDSVGGEKLTTDAAPVAPGLDFAPPTLVTFIRSVRSHTAASHTSQRTVLRL
jgi:hypothetical protein